MSETDPGCLPPSKVELAVTIINGSPVYAISSVLARRIFIYHLYPHCCYPVNSLAIVLLGLLYLFAYKPGKV